MTSLMCAMLRSVGVESKLCIGYLDGKTEHFWVLARNGKKWLRCDPAPAANMRSKSTSEHSYKALYKL